MEESKTKTLPFPSRSPHRVQSSPPTLSCQMWTPHLPHRTFPLADPQTCAFRFSHLVVSSFFYFDLD